MARPVRHTIARRILISFAVAVTAFAVTLGFGVRALRQSQSASERLSDVLVPVALKLGQLRATQATLATLVDGVSDERDPVSTRHLLGTLASERSVRVAELETAIATLSAQPGDLGAVGYQMAARLATVNALLVRDSAHFESLFAALGTRDEPGTARELVELGAIEHDASHALRGMSASVSEAIAAVSSEGRTRVAQSLLALFVLAAGTLALGVFVAVRTQRLLRPLASLLARVRAVAAGDRKPHPITPTDTEIGELEVGFEQMVDALESEQTRRLSNERFAAIGKMAAHVTHEIRNPLNSISLNLELLEDERAGSEERDLLRAVRREVERLENLSEEYLRLARLPSPRKEVGDVQALVRRVVEFEKQDLIRTDVTVDIRASGPMPPVAFDEGQLRQALVNLLRNAREAMPAGGAVEVTLATRALDVSLEVADRGGGIPDEIQPRVFDPFFSTKGEGTGLGLSITKQIVESHDGTITYRSRPGGGSIFAITLPLAVVGPDRK